MTVKVNVLITYRGEQRRIAASQASLSKAQDFLANRADILEKGGNDPIVAVKGDHGECYEFPPGKSKSPNLVRAGRDHWGLTHNRFRTGKAADWYILACHILRSEEYRTAAPDCNHKGPMPVEHVCEAFEVVDAQPKKEELDDIPEVMDVYDIEDDPFEDDFYEIMGDALPTAQNPETPGAGPLDVAGILQALGAAGTSSMFLHLCSRGNAITDLAIVTNLQGDDGIRLYKESLQAARAVAAPPIPFRPSAFIDSSKVADLYVEESPLPLACTDVVKALGPMKAAEFSRERTEFKQLRNAFHETFKNDNLRRVLLSRGYRLHRQLNAEGRQDRNEWDENRWYAEKIPAEDDSTTDKTTTSATPAEEPDKEEA